MRQRLRLFKQKGHSNAVLCVPTVSRVEFVIQLDKGRNKVDIQEGVIQEAYPSVFTILTDDTEDRPSQLLSFSYTDIITKEIRMKLC